jgi:hypothetical protein
MTDWRWLGRKRPWPNKALSGIWVQESRENMENLSQDSPYPGRDSNRVIREYKPTVLPLLQPVRYVFFRNTFVKKINDRASNVMEICRKNLGTVFIPWEAICIYIYIYIVCVCVSAPRQLEWVRGNADGSAIWRLGYKSCLQGYTRSK